MEYRVDIQPVCSLRHENGNCLPVGGCCPAVSKEMCAALQGAYNAGSTDGIRWRIGFHAKKSKENPLSIDRLEDLVKRLNKYSYEHKFYSGITAEAADAITYLVDEIRRIKGDVDNEYD